MVKNNSFLKGTLALAFSTILLKIIGVMYKIPLSYILGDEGMGYFNSAYTVYTLFYIIGTAGIPRAITILISKSEAEGKNSSDAIRNQALMFFLLISTFLFLIFILFAKKISIYISNEKSIYSMYAIAPAIIFVTLSGVLRGYYGGKLKFSLIAISEIITGLSKLVIGLILARYSYSQSMPTHIISAYTISGISIGSALSFIFLLIFVRNREKSKAVRIKISQTIKAIIKIAIPITLSSAVSSIASILDLTLIMKGLIKNGYTPELSNIIYGNYTTLALPMFTLISSLITQISTALVPNLTRYHTSNKIEEFSKEANNALSISYFIILPMAAIFLFFPYEVLGLLFEKGSVSLGYLLLAALSPSIILLGPLTIMNTQLEATSNINASVISLGAGAAFKLIVCASFMGSTDIGIYIAPISTFLSYLLSLIISYSFIRKKKLYKLSYTSTTKNYIIPVSITIIVGILVKLLYQKVEITRLHYALLLIIMGSIYLVLSLLLSKKTRNFILNFVKTNKNSKRKL